MESVVRDVPNICKKCKYSSQLSNIRNFLHHAVSEHHSSLLIFSLAGQIDVKFKGQTLWSQKLLSITDTSFSFQLIGKSQFLFVIAN